MSEMDKLVREDGLGKWINYEAYEEVKKENEELKKAVEDYCKHLCVTCPDVSIPKEAYSKHKYCEGCGTLKYYKLLERIEG
jgi:tRNA(Ile)-lysidine synthase TilS/MesJ